MWCILGNNLDAAALLASSSDLSLKQWQHETSSEGLKAATLAASSHVPPNNSSKSNTSNSSKSNEPKSVDETRPLPEKPSAASLAAIRAAKVSARDTAAKALPEAYVWADRTFSIKSKASRESIPLPRAKADTPIYIEAIPTMRATKPVTPAPVQLATSMEQPNYLDNIAVVEKISRHNVDKRISLQNRPPEASIKSKNRTAAKGSSPSHILTNHDSNENRLLTKRDSFLASSQTHEAIVTLARARASQTILELNEEVYYRNPTLNHEIYSAAHAIAAEKGKERLANYGKVDIGGGVFMTQSSIDAIAESHVRPVLNEISEKAQAQRLADQARKEIADNIKRKLARNKRFKRDKSSTNYELQKGKSISDTESNKEYEASLLSDQSSFDSRRAARASVAAESRYSKADSLAELTKHDLTGPLKQHSEHRNARNKTIETVLESEYHGNHDRPTLLSERRVSRSSFQSSIPEDRPISYRSSFETISDIQSIPRSTYSNVSAPSHYGYISKSVTSETSQAIKAVPALARHSMSDTISRQESYSLSPNTPIKFRENFGDMKSDNSVYTGPSSSYDFSEISSQKRGWFRKVKSKLSFSKHNAPVTNSNLPSVTTKANSGFSP